jgi:hypothetical protein
MPRHAIERTARYVLLVIVAYALISWSSWSVAFAQTSGGPPPAVTNWTLVVTVLSAIVAFLTNAYQSGSFFGLETVPGPVLPYLMLGASFLGAVGSSIGAVAEAGGSVTIAVIANALLQGVLAIFGYAAGATAHAKLTDHFSLHESTIPDVPVPPLSPPGPPSIPPPPITVPSV